MPKCDFSQLSKLMDLVEHFELHQEEALAIGETLSLVSFLYLHFITSEEHEHDDHQEHKNLPLQKISNSLFFFLTNPTTTFINKNLPQEKLKYTPKLYISKFIASIFHPPCFSA